MVTPLYVNLLVKPKNNSGFLEKYHSMHFERLNAFQNAWKCIFSRKKWKKYVCLPFLKISDPLPETHLFFYLAQAIILLMRWLSFGYDVAVCVFWLFLGVPWAGQPSMIVVFPGHTH